MKGRETKKLKGPPSADLLVCFPSRSHLALMPKAICSPGRSAELSKHHHRRKSGAVVQASPLALAKTKPLSSEIISEPTSPKVTCAGQIKIRHKAATRPCKSWQSVMEEIEKIHHRKHEKRSSWAEALGFKKEVMQFLTFLRNIKLDFRCFGAFPASDITSDDEDEDDHEEEEGDGGEDASATVFSKWFMVLQENQDSEFFKSDNNNNGNKEETKKCSNDEAVVVPPSVPPPNALLLMRCRSAPPVKSWFKEKEFHHDEKEEEEDDDDDEEDEEEEDEDDEDDKETTKNGERRSTQLKFLMEEEKRKDEEEKRKESLLVMKYGTHHHNSFDKISNDIAKETWVLCGNGDPFSRSRSWKR